MKWRKGFYRLITYNIFCSFIYFEINQRTYIYDRSKLIKTAIRFNDSNSYVLLS